MKYMCNIWRQTGAETLKSEVGMSTSGKVTAFLSDNLTKMPGIGSNYSVSHRIKGIGFQKGFTDYLSNVIRENWNPE